MHYIQHILALAGVLLTDIDVRVLPLPHILQ